MMKKELILLVFVLFGIEVQAQKYYAQDGNYDEQSFISSQEEINTPGNFYLSMNYSIALPNSKEFKGYIESTSYYGVGTEFQYFLNKNFSVGGELSYQDFTEKHQNVLVSDESGFEKSTQFRNLVVLDITAKSRYNVKLGDSFYPYVGFGLGVSKVYADTEISRYIYSDQSTALILKPELGVLIKLTDGIYLNANYSYNGILGAFTSDSNLSFSKFSTGIVIK